MEEKKKKKKLVRRIIGWVIYLAVLAVLIWGIPKVMSYALNTNYPMASITSGSMWPSLKKGDLVFIKGVDRGDIDIGDIIVFQNQKGFTIHRVIEKNEETLITKGDANNVNDSPVRYEDVIGKAVERKDKPIRIPLIGHINILVNKSRI